ncbi:acyltransferase family-domain-containing protein [Hypoxylon sp. FL1857]|nr:acyltransferase family-domain-containing protein [Hypoxylon sp. FL1857]
MMGPLSWIRRQLDTRMGYHHLSNSTDQFQKADDTDPPELHNDADISELQSTPKKRLAIGSHFKKLVVLLPSFLHPSDPNASPRNLHKTAWLDGLRGIAAFFVVWHHISLIWFSWDIHNGWTSFSDPFIRFPIIRLTISGLPNVMVFFVISGYALSYKPLSLLRQDRLLDVYHALASSAFRRHPRLFLPAVMLCLPCIFIAYLGLYGDGERDGMGWVYNNALWTLPIEFRSSLVVFGLLLALSRVGNGVRVFIELGVALYCLCFIHWAEFLFLGGMLLADLHFHFSEHRECDGSRGPEAKIRWRCSRVIVSAVHWCWRWVMSCHILKVLAPLASFLGALYLLGMPKLERGGAETPGFEALASLIPERWRAAGSPDHFWPSLAAVWLVLSIECAPFLQRVFTCRFAQYLGRISYSLYLVHLVILHSFGFRMGKFLVGLTGSDTELRYFTGILGTSVAFWFVTIWVADLGWRFVDAKVVRFSSWTYNWLCT